MPRKAITEGGKREEILDAALRLFFEHGYEGTSIRMIQKEVGCEVGLFYYYFKNKDEAFEKAIDRFFESYRGDFERILARCARDPFFALYDLFSYIGEQTEVFRRRYADKLHWTVRWAIRERVLSRLEPYIRQILDTLVSYNTALTLTPEVTAKFLTYGVGSTILHESREGYLQKKEELQRGIRLLMGIGEESEQMFPQYADESDIPTWLALSEKITENFPIPDRQEYCRMLSERIAAREALVIRHQSRVIGAAIFSKAKKSIDYLAVDPDHRKQGLASRLLITLLGRFEPGQTVSVAFRSDSPSADDARRLYQRFGFTGGKSLTAFGHSCEWMTCRIAEYGGKQKNKKSKEAES